MSHKNRDWSKYNKSLVNRGNIFLWVSPEALSDWNAKRRKCKLGRPYKFSDTSITTAATLRYVFNLSLRTCQGFLRALFQMLKIELDVPCYTQVCKRMKKIELPSHLLQRKKIKHVVIDCTGLKVYGEGEWKVKKHGVGSRRTWKKLHLAIDEKTQEIDFCRHYLRVRPRYEICPRNSEAQKGGETDLNGWCCRFFVAPSFG